MIKLTVEEMDKIAEEIGAQDTIKRLCEAACLQGASLDEIGTQLEKAGILKAQTATIGGRTEIRITSAQAIELTINLWQLAKSYGATDSSLENFMRILPIKLVLNSTGAVDGSDNNETQ